MDTHSTKDSNLTTTQRGQKAYWTGSDYRLDYTADWRRLVDRLPQRERQYRAPTVSLEMDVKLDGIPRLHEGFKSRIREFHRGRILQPHFLEPFLG